MIASDGSTAETNKCLDSINEHLSSYLFQGDFRDRRCSNIYIFLLFEERIPAQYGG